MNKYTINYSQCWEDPEVLTKALNIKANDIVLSVTSGGDNTLALLLCNPKRIVAIDSNPAQNHLLELKLAATNGLNYNEYLSFLGATDSCSRHQSFTKIRRYLTNEANDWWSTNDKLIEIGIINGGRFERFLNLFRKYFLPLVHSTETITKFLSVSSLKLQRKFYKNHWNIKKWRMYFRLATSSYVLKYLARQRGMFKYTEMKIFSDKYLNRLESNIYNIPITSNNYLHYCLTGNFGKALPIYLKRMSYETLKENKTNKLSIVTNDLLDHLMSISSNSYSKYNLSDVFEALSNREIDKLWKEIIRTSKKDAIIVYWDNLLPRPVPSKFSDMVKAEKNLQRKLTQQDRVFFYGGLHVYKVIK